MPTYEYKCKSCDKLIEIEQSFSDDPITTIEGCTVESTGNHQLKKVFSAVGIAFKGSGFYRNDARSTSSSSGSSATKADSSTGDQPSADSSSETKPEKSDKTSADNSSSTKTTSSDNKSSTSSE